MTQPDDESLKRIRNGDSAAFTAMVRKYEHAMLRSAFRILGQQAEAEEVRQHVLMKIWQEPQQLPVANRLGAWLHRCVVNESIGRLRSQKRQHQRNSALAETLTESDVESRNEEFEEVRQAMLQLTPEQRAILSLKFDEQMTVRQISRVLDKPHTTVQSQLKKAINDLRAVLQIVAKNSEGTK